MKIKRMVKHSDTEYEIMEFELTEEETQAIYSQFKEKIDRAWMREILEDQFADEYPEVTEKGSCDVEALLDDAYEEYCDRVTEAEWDTVYNILLQKCAEFFEEE